MSGAPTSHFSPRCRLALAAAVGASAVLAACAALIPIRAMTESAEPEPAPETPKADLFHTASGPELRIRILAGVDGVTIAGPGTLSIGPEHRGSGWREVYPTPVTITRGESAWLLRDANGRARAIAIVTEADRQGAVSVEAVGGNGAPPITVNGKPYPGTVRLRSAAGGDGTPSGRAAPEPPSAGVFDVIETVALEEYLPGVLAKELLPGWSLNAYKAQAIAARSYAMHETARAAKAGKPFDLEATELDQAYDGAAGNETARRAVRETRGTVLSWQGAVLRAYYSSTCGGRAAAARTVWPTGPGFEFNLDAPLQGERPECVWCASSPLHRWKVERDEADLVARMSAYGRDNNFAVRDIDSFARATPSLTAVNGRPTQFRVFDAKGRWWTLSAEEFRVACNWRGSSARPATPREQRVNSGDASGEIGAGKKVRIEGRGFGHGVGLCQYGAEGMSKDGRSPEAILAFYYPGATLRKAY